MMHWPAKTKAQTGPESMYDVIRTDQGWQVQHKGTGRLMRFMDHDAWSHQGEAEKVRLMLWTAVQRITQKPTRGQW